MQEADQLEIYRLQAELCKALSESKRLRIISILRDGERTVSELVSLLELKQSNTSQHLGVLRGVGLITARRVGTTVYYRLADPKIGEACDIVHQVIASRLQNNRTLSRAMEKLT